MQAVLIIFHTVIGLYALIQLYSELEVGHNDHAVFAACITLLELLTIITITRA